MKSNLQNSKNWALGLAVCAVGAQAQTLPAVPPKSPLPVVKYEYDAEGNIARSIVAPDATGFALTTGATYDALQRPTVITDATKTGKTSIQYNGQNQVTRVIDPLALVTTTPRNGLGDVQELKSPDTGLATMTYDAAGNLATRLDSRGVTSTLKYDALNRLTQVAFTQSGKTTETLGWTYDQTGTGFAYGVGRLTTATHPNGKSTYQYDAQGRLTVESQVVNALVGANAAAVTRVATYSYDAAGHRTSIVYPSGRRVTFTQTGGVPSAISLAPTATGAATTLLSNIKWEPFGGARSWQWVMAGGALQSHDRVYDNTGRLVRYRLGPVVRDVEYDHAGRISAFKHYNATTGVAQTGLNQSFRYDALGRLTNATANGSTWSLAYDANGNRTGVTLNGSVQGYGVAATSNRLNSRTNPAATLAYDNMGNTLSDSGKAYVATFNLAGRMNTLVKAGITTFYTYDAQGRRVRKVSSTGTGSTLIYYYDPEGHLLGEYNSAGVALREYIWLGDTPVAMFTPGATASAAPIVYYIHSDHIDTPRVVVNTAGQLRWRWMAEPFGTTAPDTNPAALGVFTQNLRFPGQYADGAETGLIYNYFRDYDPSTGRYIQSDPIGLAGGINTYAYVAGNPISYVDPDGLNPLIGAAAGFAIELGLQALSNYRKDCDVFDIANYNWYVVGVSTVFGAMAPGWLAVGKTTNPSRKAIASLTEQLGRAQTAHRRAKLEGRILGHSMRIADVLVPQLGFQGVKEAGNHIAETGAPYDCRCRK